MGRSIASVVGLRRICNGDDDNTIRYDTVDKRALKSRRYGQRHLAHGTETKKIMKPKNENRVAQKKRYGHSRSVELNYK